MDMEQIDEQWVTLTNDWIKPERIVAISNTGKYRRANGEIGESVLRKTRVLYGGRRLRIGIVIARHFLITVKAPNQDCLDHITHNPKEYNVNDVRNLRWCTKKENLNFEEARSNNSKAKKGKSCPRRMKPWYLLSINTKSGACRAKKRYREYLESLNSSEL